MEENLHDGHRNRLRELAFKNNFKKSREEKCESSGNKKLLFLYV